MPALQAVMCRWSASLPRDEKTHVMAVLEESPPRIEVINMPFCEPRNLMRKQLMKFRVEMITTTRPMLAGFKMPPGPQSWSGRKGRTSIERMMNLMKAQISSCDNRVMMALNSPFRERRVVVITAAARASRIMSKPERQPSEKAIRSPISELRPR